MTEWMRMDHNMQVSGRRSQLEQKGKWTNSEQDSKEQSRRKLSRDRTAGLLPPLLHVAGRVHCRVLLHVVCVRVVAGHRRELCLHRVTKVRHAEQRHRRHGAVLDVVAGNIALAADVCWGWHTGHTRDGVARAVLDEMACSA